MRNPATRKPALCEALWHPERRFIIYLLDQTDGELTMDELAAELAQWELEDSPDADEDELIEQARISLHHIHIPKLADTNIVEFDPEERTVTLTDSAPLESVEDFDYEVEAR